MSFFLTLSAYCAFILFLIRLFSHIWSWINADKEPASDPLVNGKISPSLLWNALLDILFFRRVYATNKLLWAASWTFHLSFFLVLLRHLRYVLYPVPGFIVFIQPAGKIAGYILPLSLLLILIVRLTGGKDRYLSVYNFFLVGLLMLTSLTGIFMSSLFRTDLVNAKAFVFGMVTAAPATLPESRLFAVHFILFLVLLPSLPFHLIASPVTTIEARKREQALYKVIHEK